MTVPNGSEADAAKELELLLNRLLLLYFDLNPGWAGSEAWTGSAKASGTWAGSACAGWTVLTDFDPEVFELD